MSYMIMSCCDRAEKVLRNVISMRQKTQAQAHIFFIGDILPVEACFDS